VYGTDIEVLADIMNNFNVNNCPHAMA